MHVEGKGCKDGMHRPDEKIGNIGIAKDGDLTVLIYNCVACGKQFSIAAPLGLNDKIGDKAVEPDNPIRQEFSDSRPSGNQEDDDLRSKLRKKLFG